MKGEVPDPSYGIIGKQRSTHNTYLTLPVLFMMISNHYAFITGYAAGLGSGRPDRVGLAGSPAISCCAMKWVMSMDEIGWAVPVIAAALAGAMLLTQPSKAPVPTSRSVTIEAFAIVPTRCTCLPFGNADRSPPSRKRRRASCLPRWTISNATHQQIEAQAVRNHTMPLGNKTQYDTR